jgi:hypothetical protein
MFVEIDQQAASPTMSRVVKYDSTLASISNTQRKAVSPLQLHFFQLKHTASRGGATATIVAIDDAQ